MEAKKITRNIYKVIVHVKENLQEAISINNNELSQLNQILFENKNNDMRRIVLDSQKLYLEKKEKFRKHLRNLDELEIYYIKLDEQLKTSTKIDQELLELNITKIQTYVWVENDGQPSMYDQLKCLVVEHNLMVSEKEKNKIIESASVLEKSVVNKQRKVKTRKVIEDVIYSDMDSVVSKKTIDTFDAYKGILESTDCSTILEILNRQNFLYLTDEEYNAMIDLFINELSNVCKGSDSFQKTGILGSLKVMVSRSKLV